MRQQNRPIYSILLLILATLAWNSVEPAGAIPMIVEATSEIELFPAGASRPQLVGKNRELRRGDRLRAPRRVRVRVACDDGAIRPITGGVTIAVNTLCLPRPQSRSTRSILSPRPINRNIPYVISPRATALLTDKPTLRWNGVTGANRFQVKVRGGDLNWTGAFSRQQACQRGVCELAYPINKPLQPEVSYKLVVKADTNRSSEEDTTNGLGFKLIEAMEAREIKRMQRRLERQQQEGISEETKALFLANRYAEYNLMAEAIEILEALPRERKITQVYRLLGDLYLQIGLILEAEEQYTEAVKLAGEKENLVELAAVKVGLGEVNYARSQIEEGISLLEEAQQIYEELGDVQRAEKLNRRLEELKKIT